MNVIKLRVDINSFETCRFLVSDRYRICSLELSKIYGMDKFVYRKNMLRFYEFDTRMFKRFGDFNA